MYIYVNLRWRIVEKTTCGLWSICSSLARSAVREHIGHEVIFQVVQTIDTDTGSFKSVVTYWTLSYCGDYTANFSEYLTCFWNQAKSTIHFWERLLQGGSELFYEVSQN